MEKADYSNLLNLKIVALGQNVYDFYLNLFYMKNKNAFDDFCPWKNQSFNLSKTTESVTKKQRHTQRRTIDQVPRKNSELLARSNEKIKKNVLRTSSINLNRKSYQSQYHFQNFKNNSRKSTYKGPRISFYLKMNPKCYNRYLHLCKDSPQTREQPQTSKNINICLKQNNNFQKKIQLEPKKMLCLNYINLEPQQMKLETKQWKEQQNMKKIKKLYVDRRNII